MHTKTTSAILVKMTEVTSPARSFHYHLDPPNIKSRISHAYLSAPDDEVPVSPKTFSNTNDSTAYSEQVAIGGSRYHFLEIYHSQLFYLSDAFAFNPNILVAIPLEQIRLI